MGENLGELVESFNNINIRSVELQYNGIVRDYLKTYFKHMFNFKNLVELNLSSNWFGIDGLYEIRKEFSKFESLRILKLGTNRLCFGSPVEELPA